MNHRRAALLSLGLLVTALPATANAQGTTPAGTDSKVANYVPEETITETDKKQGMDGTLAVAANVNLTSNRRVVGQVDGFSFLFGVSLIGGLDYVDGPHEVRNTLSLNESWARTPVLPEFVKANDVLDLESVYNFFVLSWFGPFARLNLQSTVLQTEDVRAEPVTYLVMRNTGLPETLQGRERLVLSDPFSPLTLNESVGLFAEPYDSRQISVSLRLGLGARETFADGVLVLTDDSDTDEFVEVTELSNVYQGGLELFAGVDGKIFGKRVLYDVGASVLFPFLNNDPEDRGGFDLTRVGVAATVGLNVVDWMIVQYQAKVLRDPQLLDEIQLQNNVLLTFQYTFIERNAEAVAELDQQRAEEAKKAEAAEARIRAAETEAQRLREELEKIKAQPAEPVEDAPKAPETPGPEGGEKPPAEAQP